jgi:hypothetical protein
MKTSGEIEKALFMCVREIINNIIILKIFFMNIS